MGDSRTCKMCKGFGTLYESQCEDFVDGGENTYDFYQSCLDKIIDCPKCKGRGFMGDEQFEFNFTNET